MSQWPHLLCKHYIQNVSRLFQRDMINLEIHSIVKIQFQLSSLLCEVPQLLYAGLKSNLRNIFQYSVAVWKKSAPWKEQIHAKGKLQLTRYAVSLKVQTK